MSGGIGTHTATAIACLSDFRSHNGRCKLARRQNLPKLRVLPALFHRIPRRRPLPKDRRRSAAYDTKLLKTGVPLFGRSADCGRSQCREVLNPAPQVRLSGSGRCWQQGSARVVAARPSVCSHLTGCGCAVCNPAGRKSLAALTILCGGAAPVQWGGFTSYPVQWGGFTRYPV